MKILVLACFLAIPVLAAGAGTNAPEGFEHWTSASLKEKVAALRPEAAKDPSGAASEKLASFPNEYFLMAIREKDGTPEWHENEVDVFVVKSGSATLIVGGKLMGAKDVAPHEKRGGTIEGGATVHLSTGDVVRIPAKTPHELLLKGSQEFDYFVIKVKGY